MLFLNNLTFRWSAFPIAQRKKAQRSTTTPPLFPLHSRKSILTENERYLNRVILEDRFKDYDSEYVAEEFDQGSPVGKDNRTKNRCDIIDRTYEVFGCDQ